jgi:uncharacterized protein YdiU (UPF0061 family)
MTVDTRPLFAFDNTFVRQLAGMFEPWQAAAAPAPQLLVLNEGLAAELGVPADALRTPDGVATLVGNAIAPGSEPIAQAYAGHQFGGYSPRLGDGRALLLGEVIDAQGQRRDLHLKGSGRTPFARGGDGRAAVGPMLREYLMGEAMHALGIPTTRALAVVATGDDIVRDGGLLPGAVLVRVASSHLRVGSFQYANATRDGHLLQRLTDYAIERHHPQAAQAERPALALLDSVVGVQASLVARWMLVGFVHGVMNTDNTTISGETIDYGPCAFMDAYDPGTVFSSIDHQGRYAYGNQPQIAMWNLARLAEALLPLIDPDTDRAVALATEVLESFVPRFHSAYDGSMRAKLGMGDEQPGDADMVNDLFRLLRDGRRDFTGSFRELADVLRGGPVPEVLTEWALGWQRRLVGPHLAIADAMDAVNPLYIPRNHLVEESLAAATAGDLSAFMQLLGVLQAPFVRRDGLERYEQPAPDSFEGYMTFCGT